MAIPSTAPVGARPEGDRLVSDARAARAAGRLHDMARLLERALALSPDNVDALQDYALLALQVNKASLAVAHAARWATLQPGDAAAHATLGVALRHCGRLPDALASLSRAVQLAPDAFDVRVNLGNVLVDSGAAAEALPHYQHALRLDPQSASVHNNLGNLHRELRQPTEALASYRRALALDPAHAWAWNNVGNILKDLADTEGAVAAFRQALVLAPDRSAVWSNLLLTLNASEAVTATALAAEHRAFGRHFATLIPALPPMPPLPLAGRRLRVGFVSADFRRHAVATFFQPLLAALDRSEVEVFCYFNQPRGDEVTARICDLAEHFLPVAGLPDRVLAERIRQDGIDVLVDLGGHTADNRMPLFFLAPALVQVGWLGYLGATGVPTLAWRLSDPHADAAADVATAGLEPAWRLPRTLWCYEPYREAPLPGPLPCARNGFMTFGCLNNPGKVGPTMLAAWIELLRGVPDARLKLLTSPDAAREQALLAQFAAAGVAPARIDLLARMPVAQYLHVYQEVDIALDTWPYTGGTTTCDALWMGVPVVTLASDRPFARSGASILAQVALSGLVTADAAAYVACAQALARDPARVATLRATLRPRMLASPLLDATAFARDFTQALYAMWQHKAGVAPDVQA